jgi:hypothetical protein
MPFWSSKEKVTYGEGLIPSDLLRAVRDRSTDDNDSKAQLTDGVLSRFLEDAKYDTDKAVEMVQQYIKYRADNGVGEMLANPPHENIFRKYTIGTWHKTDREGHPINYDVRTEKLFWLSLPHPPCITPIDTLASISRRH